MRHREEADFISALGYFAFLQSKGIWGLFGRLAMSCAIPTVSRDSSKDGECGWDHGKSAFIRSTEGKRKKIELRKKSFQWSRQQLSHISLFLWGHSRDSCFCLCLSPSYLPVLCGGHLSLPLYGLHLDNSLHSTMNSI